MSPLFQKTLSELDRLIAKHGVANPDIKHELENLRTQLIEAQRRKDAADLVKIALQLASWIRWIMNLLD